MRNFSDLERSDFMEKRSLLCQLTQDEVRQRGETLAEISEKIDIKDAEMKAVAKQFKEEIGKLKSEGGVVRDAVRTHTEYRQTECVWYYDWGNGVRILVRTDTQAEVEREEIPEDERQMRFE